MSKKTKKIVCIGGGTGVSMILSGLKKYPVDLTAIVTMFDSGGSSGKLRRELGVLPIGDIRQSLISTADNTDLAQIFNYRDAGESMGNYLIIEEERKNKSLEKAIRNWKKKLRAKADIIPVVLKESDIVVLLKNNKKIKEEENIINCRYLSKIGIKKLFLEPEVNANPRAVSAIKDADLIIIGPGKFYTSLIPNLLVRGITEAIRSSKAKKIFVCNLMTQLGNTDNLGVENFVDILEEYLGENKINHVIFNTGKLSPLLLKVVRKSFPGADLVKYGEGLLKNKKFIGKNVLNRKIRKLNPADILVRGANQRTQVLHDSQKLAKIILNICKQK